MTQGPMVRPPGPVKVANSAAFNTQVGVGPLPNLFGQLSGFSGKCNKLRVWWNLNEKTASLQLKGEGGGRGRGGPAPRCAHACGAFVYVWLVQPAALHILGAHCVLRAVDARAQRHTCAAAHLRRR